MYNSKNSKCIFVKLAKYTHHKARILQNPLWLEKLTALYLTYILVSALTLYQYILVSAPILYSYLLVSAPTQTLDHAALPPSNSPDTRLATAAAGAFVSPCIPPPEESSDCQSPSDYNWPGPFLVLASPSSRFRTSVFQQYKVVGFILRTDIKFISEFN